MTGAELAVTYLNLCAVYSELNHHHEAINKSIKAVVLCKNYVKKWNQENNDVTDLVDQDLDLDSDSDTDSDTDLDSDLDLDSDSA